MHPQKHIERISFRPPAFQYPAFGSTEYVYAGNKPSGTRIHMRCREAVKTTDTFFLSRARDRF